MSQRGRKNAQTDRQTDREHAELLYSRSVPSNGVPMTLSAWGVSMESVTQERNGRQSGLHFLPVAVRTLAQMPVIPDSTQKPHRNSGVSLRMMELFRGNRGLQRAYFEEKSIKG